MSSAYNLSESYTWKITDPSLIQKIRSAQPGDAFYSPKFSLCPPLRWQFESFPHGESNKSKGSVLIYTNLIAMTPNIKQFRIRRQYTFVEGNIVRATTVNVTKDQMYLNG